MNAPQGFTENFNLHADVLRSAAVAQDHDDLQNAISGADVGRMRKHGVGEHIDPSTGEKRKSIAERTAQTLEWLLLNNANYARLHRAATSSVQRVAQHAENTLVRVLSELEHVQGRIGSTLENAALLPDGRRAFLDKNGVAKDASGSVISAEIAAGIQWTGDEPSYEEYQALLERADALEAAANEVRGIETELGGLQGELSDNDEPPSADRLEDISEYSGDLHSRLEGIQLDIERTQSKQLDLQASPAGLEKTLSAEITLPDLQVVR